MWEGVRGFLNVGGNGGGEFEDLVGVRYLCGFFRWLGN